MADVPDALRRRDALVAEHVFGWTEIAERRHPFHGDVGELVGRPPDVTPHVRAAYRVECYTTMWHAAGQVIDRMRELGWDMNLSIEHRTLGRPVDCRFWSSNGKRAMAFDETAPLAICRAALKALGVDA